MEEHKCIYCGADALYQLKNKKWCCQPHSQSCPINREKKRQTIKARWNQLREAGYKTQFLKDLGDDRGMFSKYTASEEILKRKQQLEHHPESCFCDHCGQPAKYVLKCGSYCCEQTSAKCPAVRLKNSQAVKKAHEEGRIQMYFNEETWQASQRTRNKQLVDKFEQFLDQGDIFKLRNEAESRVYPLLRALIQSGFRERECEICHLAEWNGQLIPLEVHHINGNRLDDRLENLQILCPNCHAQTNNWRGRKSHQKKHIIHTDEEYIIALRNNNTIAKALKSMDLSYSESSYQRARNIMSRYSITLGEDIN